MTIYGRNAVSEALEDESLMLHKLHLSISNRPSLQIDDMVKMATARGVPIAYHDKNRLSRISKNAKQDQGVALDIILSETEYAPEFFHKKESFRIIALDGIHNPQNLGMIIRSCAAGNIDAIILPIKKSAKISPLAIKASAGTLFRLPIIKTDNLLETLKEFQKNSAKVYTLSSSAAQDYKEMSYAPKSIFVLGNESEGVSKEVATLSDEVISIPMRRGVESLNVAVTASLLAFM